MNKNVIFDKSTKTDANERNNSLEEQSTTQATDTLSMKEQF